MDYMQSPAFHDRRDAGRRLASELAHYHPGAVVLAVPRGGVPVAVEVARRLHVQLDIVVVRKIPIPSEPEAGYGAISEEGEISLNEPVVAILKLSQSDIATQASKIQAEISRRSALFRSYLTSVDLMGATAIVIDDGLASGFTMAAAVASVKKRGAAKVVVAVPVASSSAYWLIQSVADEIVSVVISSSSPFSVASFYEHWYDLTDDEVIHYLRQWSSTHSEVARPVPRHHP